MGQAIVRQQQTVTVPNEYVDTIYCVRRTSGEIDKDHMSCKEPHRQMKDLGNFTCRSIYDDQFEWAANHAIKRKGLWRVYLQSNSEDKHVCGWRLVNNFWPLELDEQENKINEWHSKLIEILEELELERKKKYPDSDQEETNQ
jgi:hypothetical protein